MEKSSELGTNKTGIDMSPIHTKHMIDTDGIDQVDEGAREDMLAFKRSYIENADPLGSVPMPGTVKGAVKSAMKMMTGKHPEAFINKLGERLAYERSGVRIYEALITKCQYAAGNQMASIDIPMQRLQEFRAQEAEHFAMLTECIEHLGADPTAQTPDADASGVAASGLMKVIVDPRTSLSQSLEAMLSLELTDNAAWELLVTLAEDMGMPDMAQKFQHALRQEELHLQEVRQWYEQSVRAQAKLGGSTH